MDCENFHKKLADYENLSVKDKAELLEHTEVCSSCAKELSDYTNMIETLKSLPELKAPDDFIAKLNERIDKEKPVREKAPGIWEHLKQHSYRYSAAAACIMLAVVIGVNGTEFVDKMKGSDSDIPTDISMMSTEKPRDAKSSQEDPKASSAPTGTPAPETSPKPTASTSGTKAAAAKSTQKPLATAIPSKQQKKTSPTLSPRITAAPAAGNSTPETSHESVQDNGTSASTETQTFSSGTAENNQSTDTLPAAETPAADPANNDIMVASPGTQPSDDPALNSIMDPSQYSLPEKENGAADGNVGGGSGYSRSTETSNSIEVSLANAERAREIISEYSVASDGDCYSVSADRMDEFLEAMNNAGIDYDQNCVDMDSDTVTFRLVIS